MENNFIPMNNFIVSIIILRASVTMGEDRRRKKAALSH